MAAAGRRPLLQLLRQRQSRRLWHPACRINCFWSAPCTAVPSAGCCAGGGVHRRSRLGDGAAFAGLLPLVHQDVAVPRMILRHQTTQHDLSSNWVHTRGMQAINSGNTHTLAGRQYTV